MNSKIYHASWQVLVFENHRYFRLSFRELVFALESCDADIVLFFSTQYSKIALRVYVATQTKQKSCKMKAKIYAK